MDSSFAVPTGKEVIENRVSSAYTRGLQSRKPNRNQTSLAKVYLPLNLMGNSMPNIINLVRDMMHARVHLLRSAIYDVMVLTTIMAALPMHLNAPVIGINTGWVLCDSQLSVPLDATFIGLCHGSQSSRMVARETMVPSPKLLNSSALQCQRAVNRVWSNVSLRRQM
jgi:hypothetical protein